METLWSDFFLAKEAVKAHLSVARDRCGARALLPGNSTSGWIIPWDTTLMTTPADAENWIPPRSEIPSPHPRSQSPQTIFRYRAGRLTDDKDWQQADRDWKAKHPAGVSGRNGRPPVTRPSEIRVGDIRALIGAKQIAGESARTRSTLLSYHHDFVARDERDFVAAVNALALGLAAAKTGNRPSPWKTPTPKRLGRSCRAENKIIPQAELVYFGAWLLRLGKPGYSKRGPNPDDLVVFRTIAAILSASLCHSLAKPRPGAGATGQPSSAPLRLRATGLRDYWAILYGELLDVATVRSRLRSAQNLLEGYLGFLATRKIRPPQGVRRRALRSPLLVAAYEAVKLEVPAAPT